MPSAKIANKVDAPADRVAELLRTSLAQSGWRIELINEALCELTANLHQNERVKGVNWAYEYRCVASWEPVDESVLVEIEVTENKNKWTQSNCTSKAAELMQGLISKAAKLARLDKGKPAADRYGSARWGEQEDIVKAGYCGGYEDSRRLVVSQGFDGEFVTLTPEDTIKHAIVCGPTGSGKTTAVFIPNLVGRLESSAIVTEATAGAEPPDLYHRTGGYRWMAGNHQVYYFNPDDLRSVRINPIDTVTSYAKAQELSQLIVENTTSKNNYGDDVWPKSEANLLTILIAHAAAEKKHLGYIRALLREGPNGLLPIMKESKVEEVRDEYRGFSNNAREGFKYGVFAGLIQRLGLWVNPRIVALTETTDFEIDELAKNLFTFYLATPAQKTHLKPVAALIFNFILEQALTKEFTHPLFLSLDEFTNFGMIPAIADKLSIIRHKNIGVMLGFQDYSQLVKVYGRDDAQQMFSQPGTKFFFRPRTLDVAQMISKMAGMTTIYERKMTSSGQIQERESGRPLIDPGEVLALDDNEMLLFTPRCPPMKMPRFTWEDYKSAASMPPVSSPEIEIDERLVKECNETKKKQDWQEAGEKIRVKEMNEESEPAGKEERPKTKPKPKAKAKPKTRPKRSKPKDEQGTSPVRNKEPKEPEKPQTDKEPDKPDLAQESGMSFE